MLERLFATERFGVAEDLLKQRRMDAGRALEAARGAVRDVAQRLCQATSCEGEEAWESDPASLAPWLQERLVGAEASLITATSVCSDAAASRSAADTALRAASERADRARRHAEAVAAVEALLARRPEYDRAVQELFDARGATGIAPLLAEGDRLAARATAAERAATAALGELGELTGEPD
ncbi:MAG: repair exonuclease, SbcC, partial [Solirubrobacterales bacterium]|nr:repair exonuclease, SbcC [Solirubrobacterales bacterium]